MGIPVALHGFVGGGTSLNYDVVQYEPGSEPPESAEANTIVVFTDVDITGHIFSATEPENMANGEVWFATGTSSPVAFNALKKNGIEVYPMSAKQCVDGECVDVPAMTYQGGEWVEWWNGYFYKDGSFFASHSEMRKPSTAPITYMDDHIELKTVAGNVSETYVVVGPVDMSNFTEISAEFTIHGLGYATIVASLFVSKTEGAGYANAVAKNECVNTSELNGSKDVSAAIDVSSLSGDYYIHAGTHTQGAAWGNARTVYVNAIGGEMA